MADKELKNRNDIPKEFKWDIEKMYPDESQWDKDIEWCIKESENYMKKYQGHICDSKDSLLNSLKDKDSIFLVLERALTYAHMKKDEDNRVNKYVGMDDKAGSAISKVFTYLAFYSPELLSNDEEKILGYIKESEDLKVYEFALKDALREKAHILTEAEENILAQMSEVTGATNDIFTMLNNAEMSFGNVVDEDGDTVKLTHGNYITFMESHNRDVRKNAYTNMYEAYKNLINTISTTYNYNVKVDCVTARIRKYSSARACALSSGNISEEVYDNLISVVHEYLPVLHKYIELRKQILNVDELKMYDVYVPLIELPKKEIPYEDALKIAKAGLNPLGEEYLSHFQEGIDSRWIDVYENEGKTSGAYSFGSYDSMPYVLLNYSSSLKDVFTIVHEMGHSMHSYYTRANQPYCYGDHSIFTAEVASTVNESLLMQYLLKVEKDPEMKKYLVNYYIEEFRTTLFRQTMFAEFEQLTHKEIENGGVLTADWMCQKYDDLNKQYFGPAISEDEYIKYEWARIPHFYRGFYVYQYATSFCAAVAIAHNILEEGTPAVERYKKFLSGGCSQSPIDLLKIAGVDLSTPEPIDAALNIFDGLIEELEKLI